MPLLLPDSLEVLQIDAALQQWRQGDLALDERWFNHVADPQMPLTEASAAEGGEEVQAIQSAVDGLVVVSQTCDIVRSCLGRPYVEVAPLVKVSPEHLLEVKRGRRPGLATLPALLPRELAVDLDRVMTVEKSLLASWERTPGYDLDSEGRLFAQALARKRVRFAFPNDFVDLVGKLQKRLSVKHGKNTNEGRGLWALREIRIQATPYWDAQEVSLFFWFLRNEETPDFEGTSWSELMDSWLQLITPQGRFTSVEGQVAELADMTARDYVASDQLDLDHLSSGRALPK